MKLLITPYKPYKSLRLLEFIDYTDNSANNNKHKTSPNSTMFNVEQIIKILTKHSQVFIFMIECFCRATFYKISAGNFKIMSLTTSKKFQAVMELVAFKLE